MRDRYDHSEPSGQWPAPQPRPIPGQPLGPFTRIDERLDTLWAEDAADTGWAQDPRGGRRRARRDGPGHEPPALADDDPGLARDQGLRRLSRLTWRATQLSALAAVGFATLFARTAPAASTTSAPQSTAPSPAAASPTASASATASSTVKATAKATAKASKSAAAQPAASAGAPATSAAAAPAPTPTHSIAPPTTAPAPTPTPAPTHSTTSGSPSA